jgi:DNA invertase Pin-like site-specific DNA recombinase
MRTSTESGLGIEAQVYSIQNWWRYQREGKNFPDHAWSPVGWKGEKDDGAETDDGLFIDQSVSAFKTRLVKRQAGIRLEDCLWPEDLVVFARLDRAFRGVADFAVTVDRWLKRGILVQFITPQVDLTSAPGRAFAQIAAVFAELESALKSERLREAQARGRERGQKMGRHASFGWKQQGWTTRVVDGVAKKVPHMVPDEQEREEVRLIEEFHDIHKLSFAAIADLLEVRRAANESRQPWPRSISGIREAAVECKPVSQGLPGEKASADAGMEARGFAGLRVVALLLAKCSNVCLCVEFVFTLFACICTLFRT